MTAPWHLHNASHLKTYEEGFTVAVMAARLDLTWIQQKEIKMQQAVSSAPGSKCIGPSLLPIKADGRIWKLVWLTGLMTSPSQPHSEPEDKCIFNIWTLSRVLRRTESDGAATNKIISYKSLGSLKAHHSSPVQAWPGLKTSLSSPVCLC